MNKNDLLKLGVINFIIVFLGSYIAIAVYMSQFSLPAKCNMRPPMAMPMDKRMKDAMKPPVDGKNAQNKKMQMPPPPPMPMKMPTNMPNGPQPPVGEPSQQ